MTEWISVDDRLPNDCILVLGFRGGRLSGDYVLTEYDNDSKTWWLEHIGYIEITHWMPLPKPPNDEHKLKNKIAKIGDLDKPFCHPTTYVKETEGL